MPDPSSQNPAADAIVGRIRELARSHGVSVRDDAGMADLLADLRLSNGMPIAAFAVAADLLFHLLAADQRPQIETAP